MAPASPLLCIPNSSASTDSRAKRFSLSEILWFTMQPGVLPAAAPMAIDGDFNVDEFALY